MSNNPPQQPADFDGVSLIGNRYRLKQKLGKGTFGEVFLADDLKFNPPRAVAIKMLHPKFLDEAEVRADIEREASVLARFNHANILRVIDFDISESQAYIVTDLAEGGSLSRKIRPNAAYPPVRMPLNEVAGYLEQISDALDDAHSAGLIHRDLKPLNILLTKRGRPLIADFGLATAVSSSQSSVLVDSSTSGTPPYMAPEQWMGHVGRASDIYALGIITYQLITGELPYQGSVFEIMGQHLHAPIPKLSDHAPGLNYPPALDNLLAGVMAKEPKQRPRSATEFYRRFKEVITPLQPQQPGTAGYSGTLPLPPPSQPGYLSTQAMPDNLPPMAPANLPPQSQADFLPTQVLPGNLPPQSQGGFLPTQVPTGNMPPQAPSGGLPPLSQPGNLPPSTNNPTGPSNRIGSQGSGIHFNPDTSDAVEKTALLGVPPVTVKRKPGLIIAVSIIAVLLLVSAVIAGILILTPGSQNNNPTPTLAAVPNPTDTAVSDATETSAPDATETPSPDATETPTPDTTPADTPTETPVTTVAASAVTTVASGTGPAAIPIYSGAIPVKLPDDVSKQLQNDFGTSANNLKLEGYKVVADDSQIHDFFVANMPKQGWTDISDQLTGDPASAIARDGLTSGGLYVKDSDLVLILVGKGNVLTGLPDVSPGENIYIVIRANT